MLALVAEQLVGRFWTIATVKSLAGVRADVTTAVEDPVGNDLDLYYRPELDPTSESTINASIFPSSPGASIDPVAIAMYETAVMRQATVTRKDGH